MAERNVPSLVSDPAPEEKWYSWRGLLKLAGQLFTWYKRWKLLQARFGLAFLLLLAFLVFLGLAGVAYLVFF